MTVLQYGVAVHPGPDGAERVRQVAQKSQNRRSALLGPAVLVGAPVGIRTPNLLIRSQMLYPLSYGR